LFSFFLLIVLFLYELSGKLAHCRTKKMAKDSKTLSMLMKKKKILMRTRACVCQIMVIVGFAQQLTTLSANVKVDFPDEFLELSDSISWLNLDVVNITSSLCNIKGSFYGTLQTQFWIMTILCVIGVFDYCRARKMNPDDDEAGVFQVKYLVMTFFSLYPQNAKTFLSFLLCREIDGRYYMQADYREQCFDDKWTSYAAIAIPGIVVYVIGTPAFFIGVLYYMKKTGTLKLPANEDKFSFLYVNYKPDFWFMEIYQLLVKCVMCSIIMFINKGSATQVAATLFFSVIFCFVALTTAPFKNTDMNANAALTTSTMVLTLFTALLLKTVIWRIDGWSQGILNGFVMAVNMITMLLFTYRFVRVQGNFLCAQYFPKPAQNCFLAFNRLMGWKPPPEPPAEPPPGAEKDADDEGDALLMAGGGSKKASDYWQQTFKVVS